MNEYEIELAFRRFQRLMEEVTQFGMALPPVAAEAGYLGERCGWFPAKPRRVRPSAARQQAGMSGATGQRPHRRTRR